MVVARFFVFFNALLLIDN